MKEETLGQVFSRYRLADKIKVAKVEEDTKISQRMILAVENDDYQVLPDDLYTTYIIKTYANYLSLDYNKLLALYEAGRQKFKFSQPQVISGEKVKVYITPKILKLGLIFAVILGLLLYLGFQVQQIYKPPLLTITYPASNLKITNNFIEITGTTEKEARVFINDKEVFLDPLGNFKATLDLQKGLNVIKIAASKRHSQSNVVFREILVE